jgi:NitT/TauT family transport system substrate-binding protein
LPAALRPTLVMERPLADHLAHWQALSWRGSWRGACLKAVQRLDQTEDDTMTRFRRTAMLLATLGLAIAGAYPASSQAPTTIKFTLDFKLQGIHAWYYVAQQKGYFQAEGLNVIFDQGEGSAVTVTRIMSGAYDAGFGDINAIIQQAANKPGEQPVMVYQIYNRPPFVLVTKANGPIKTLKDVAGKKLGGPAGSATLKLFPQFARINGIDTSGISFLNMAPTLQEQMLVQDQIEGTLVFNVTSYINLLQQKQDPENMGSTSTPTASWSRRSCSRRTRRRSRPWCA